MPGPRYIKRPTDAGVEQGDIYLNLPSVIIPARPLRVARHFRTNPKSGREEWFVHAEGVNPPQGGFDWDIDKGKVEPNMLVQGHVAMGIVLTHDCEIENDETSTRTLAMIRPPDHLNVEERELLFSGHEYWVAFPLVEQTDEPVFKRSWIDFRRLTTVREDVLQESTRLLSLSEELREAMAHAFWNYLFRRVVESEEK